MERAIAGLGVATWRADTGTGLPEGAHAGAARWRADGAPLLLHANAPVLPWALLRLPSGIVRGRRVIGYWAWELPWCRKPGELGLGLFMEIWALSHFTADAAPDLAAAWVRYRGPHRADTHCRTPPNRRRWTAPPSDCRRRRWSCWCRSAWPPATCARIRWVPWRAFRTAFGDRADRHPGAESGPIQATSPPSLPPCGKPFPAFPTSAWKPAPCRAPTTMP